MEVYLFLVLIVCSLSYQQNSSSSGLWTATETLTNYGYPNEIHWITTEDGYILETHRIIGSPKNPISKPNIPVIASHALCASSYEYIALGLNKALGLLLADYGFDVWLMNNRGNQYSTNHTIKNPNNFRDNFWDFSWHEMGIYDLPSTIDYVLNVTNSKQVFHIGVSEGATQFYVMMAKLPEYNSKVLAHFSYAPATFLCHMSNLPALLLAYPERFALNTIAVMILGSVRVNPNSPLNPCPNNRLIQNVCGSIYTPFSDSNPAQQDDEVLYNVIAHLPSGCSSKTIVHFTQSVRSCKFGEFQESVFSARQEYNLTNVQTPVYVYYSTIDTFVDVLDINTLNNTLPNGFAASSNNNNLGHADFMFGIDAPRLIYNDTIERLLNFNNGN